MFTGIIEATAEILESGDGRLTVARPSFFNDVKIGSSINVSGVCLTITRLTNEALSFDVVPETLSRTMLGEKKPGDRLNLERAMLASGRFDGHVVQGHVEGRAMVVHLKAPTPQPPPPRGEGESPVKKGRGDRRHPSRLLVQRARDLRKNATPSEDMLWQEIRDHRLGVHFRRQVPVGRYILDFYCEAHHLGVEIDGGIHATQVEYDQLRDQELSVLGVCLLHFKSEEVETNLDGTLKSIRKAIVPPLPSGGGVRGGGVLPEELGVEEKRVRGVGGEVLTIHLSPDLIANVVEKGSIAIDGVSLTVAAFEEDVVSVALIPHTLEKTTLGDLKEGDEVNVETDVMMRSARKSI